MVAVVVDWSVVSWLRELREEPSKAGGSMGVDRKKRRASVDRCGGKKRNTCYGERNGRE